MNWKIILTLNVNQDTKLFIVKRHVDILFRLFCREQMEYNGESMSTDFKLTSEPNYLMLRC